MPSREWNGQTVQIPKEVVPHGARSVGEVLCSVDNVHLELLPNVNVSLRIFVRHEPHALAVSRAAVRTDGTRRYVFLFDNGRVHRKDITVGIASPAKYEVLSGLSDGDHVAIPGDVELADGMTVRATEAK
jgi:HlyD family secretion protein